MVVSDKCVASVKIFLKVACVVNLKLAFMD